MMLGSFATALSLYEPARLEEWDLGRVESWVWGDGPADCPELCVLYGAFLAQSCTCLCPARVSQLGDQMPALIC